MAAVIVADCPRCGADKMTFDVKSETQVNIKYDWQRIFEIFSICRNCKKSTVFVVSQDEISSRDVIENGIQNIRGSLNNYFSVDGYINLRNQYSVSPPEHVPEDIKAAFNEGATCRATECWNAAGAMFRMSVDLATRPMLPKEDTEGLNKKVRRDLGLRLQWLFANGKLSADLKDLSACIREDGNDGAHAGTLGKADAEDLLDFTRSLLERLYTEPAKLRLAMERRSQRRAPQ